MQRRKTNLSGIKDTKLFCVAFSLVVGFLVIMGCLFLFSLLMTKVDLPQGAVAVMSTIALCCGAYAGGFSCAKKRRKNGLFMGIATGVAIFSVIFILSLIFAKTAVNFTAASKLFWTIVFSAIGGIVGVNSKSRRF